MQPDRLFDEFLEGAIDRSSQVAECGVHLTVRDVHRLHSHGDLDFGGSEYRPAATRTVSVIEHKPGDQYGWWRLDQGVYIVKFNERVRAGAPSMLIAPNARLLATGCSIAPTVAGAGELQSVLTVPCCGARLKENARVAILLG